MVPCKRQTSTAESLAVSNVEHSALRYMHANACYTLLNVTWCSTNTCSWIHINLMTYLFLIKNDKLFTKGWASACIGAYWKRILCLIPTRVSQILNVCVHLVFYPYMPDKVGEEWLWLPPRERWKRYCKLILWDQIITIPHGGRIKRVDMNETWAQRSYLYVGHDTFSRALWTFEDKTTSSPVPGQPSHSMKWRCAP